jgi:hypothetical protein
MRAYWYEKSKQKDCGHLRWISGRRRQHNGPGTLPYSIISFIGVKESKKYRRNYVHMYFKSVRKFSDMIVWKKLSCKVVLDICVWGWKSDLPILQVARLREKICNQNDVLHVPVKRYSRRRRMFRDPVCAGLRTTFKQATRAKIIYRISSNFL